MIRSVKQGLNRCELELVSKHYETGELERLVSHGGISTEKSLVSSNRGNRLSGWRIDLFFSLATVNFQISNILWLSVFLLLLSVFSAFVLFF